VTGTGEQVLFWVLGPLAVLGSLGLVFAKKAVHAALGMALTMIILGVFYIAQGADFLGVIQIFVYTGAVMMLFLFVIMLVGVDSSDSLVETLPGQRWVTAVLCLGLGGILVSAIGRVTFDDPVGAMVLAHRERLGRAPNQREWSTRRFRSGEHLAGLPVPGVYARHNAVDTPALLPDGTPSELSVSRVLTARDQNLLPEAHLEGEAELEQDLPRGDER